MKTYRKFTLSWPLMLCVVLALPVTGYPPGVYASSVSSYYADTDVARWVTESSIFECSLFQSIPGFGEAVFYQQAGESLRFYLQSPVSPMQEGRALLTSQPPVWRQDLAGRDLGYVTVSNGRRPVTLDAARSRLVLAELSSGPRSAKMRLCMFASRQCSLQLPIGTTIAVQWICCRSTSIR
jgi:sodium-type flagellar protein MotY